MKKFMTLLLVLFMITLAACSIEQSAGTPQPAAPPSETVGSSTEAAGGVDLLVFNRENDRLSAIPLQIDFNNMTSSVGDAVYTLSGENKPYDMIEPVYMTNSRLVLPSEPLEANFHGSVITDENSTRHFYFDDYTMDYNSEAGAFTVSQDGEPITDWMDIRYDEYIVLPASFFVDDEGSITIFGYYIGDMMSTNFTSLTYSNDDGGWYIENQHAYPNEWNEFGGQISIAQPIERNTSFSTELNCFLLNEGRNLFFISPYEETAKKVISEESIEEVLPYLDTHRESYSFFYDFGYQEGHYIATFQTYNALPGMYAVFFSESGEYEGYLLCNENGVTLFDNSNQAVSSLEMTNLLPLLYIPDGRI